MVKKGKVVDFKEALEWMEGGGEACIVAGTGPYSIKNGQFGFYSSDPRHSMCSLSLADALCSKWRLVPKMVKLGEIRSGQTLYSKSSGSTIIKRATMTANGTATFVVRSTRVPPKNWEPNLTWLSRDELNEAVWCETEPDD